MAGLLPTEFDDPRNQGLLGAALAMLAASGSSPQKRTFGQILGGAGLQGMRQYDQARVLRQRDEENRRRNQLTDMQIQRMREQLDNERQADQFFANPSNFMRPTDVYSAADVGPDKQTVMAPLPQNELALRFIQSRNPQLAKAGAAALMREGEQDKPYTVGKYLVDRNGRVIFSPPVEDQQRPPAASIQEYEYARNNGYRGSFEQWMQDKRPPTPAFTFLQTDQGIVPANTRTGQPAGGPIAQPPKKPVELKPIPPNIKTAMQENMVALKKVEDALAMVQARPQSFGGQNYLGDEVMQRKDPEGVDARAAISDIGSLKIHDRSGAAVSAAEFPRLKPFVPRATDTADTVKKKLTRFMNEYQMMLDEQMNAYSEDQGYQPYPMRRPAQAATDGWSIRKK